ncbi:zinc finger MYM-type protein 1-like protein, partial [Tanacetum coccineum]
MMSKKRTKRTIDYFFKPKVDVVQGRESPPNDNNKKEDVHDTHSSDQQDVKDNHVNESLRVEPKKDVHNSTTVNLDSFIRDLGARPSISSFPSDHQDEIRHEYIRLGPYQLSKHKYPLSRGGLNGRMRSFQEERFKRFWWLEYSETKDAAYCLPCYLFNKKPVGRVGSDRFTKQGFNKWKKVDVVQGCESPPDDNDKKEDVHDIHPSDQQDVKDNHVNESLRVEPEKDVHNSTAVNLDSFIRDPGARPSISSFPSDHQDEIRREYIRLRPYQLSKHKYPLSRGGPNGRMRSFQEIRFKRFWWLEYSETKDAAYCLPSYIFNKKPIGRVGSDRFTKKGFNKWKKVICDNDYAFITHV